MNKRFASLAVSALLLVSLLSVPALAEGTEAAADAAGDDHVIVTLTRRLPCSPKLRRKPRLLPPRRLRLTRSLLRTTQRRP